jgi:serine/threonine protein kinase
MLDDLDFGATIKGFAPGQTLSGRYALDHILGQGGMGVVWLARDEELNRAIAMKFLPEMVVRDREAIADLKRETKRSLELTHVNIVRIYDFAQGPNWAGITMEHVSGDTLSALKLDQPGGCFGVPQIAPWVEQLCCALSYAHEEARVVHRDLKPNNVMLTGAGRLKVTDFGIAGALTESVSRVSMRPSTGGTLAYMSPQQAMGEHPSATDDIYSLGATIYDLLTGKPPFYQGDIIKSLREKEVTPMSERRARLQITGKDEIPAKWEAAILSCLQKDPAKRPQSIADFAEMLFGSSLSGVVKRKTPPPPAPMINSSVTRPAEGRKVLIGGAAGVAAILVVGLGIQHFRPHPKSETTRSVAASAATPPASPPSASPAAPSPPASAQNPEELDFEALQRLAETRNPAAQGVLSLWRRIGYKAPQDLKQAVYCASEAAGAGDPVGQFVLASLYSTGECVVRNKDTANTMAAKAVPLLAPMAAQGQIAAIQCLAEAYERGLGAPREPQRALALVQKPAAGDDAAAQYRLGWMYANGDGVIVDWQRAASLFQTAGNQGHAEALLNLAMMYETGKGAPKDPQRAIEYWGKAAERGSAIAQQNLARRYRNGDGEPKDASKAAELYQKAANQENGAAMAGLAWMYLLGEGVPKDPQKSFELSQRAGSVGYSVRQAELVQLYGSATPEHPLPLDPLLATTWEAGVGTNRVRWQLSKDGQYTLSGLLKGAGTIGGSDGRLLQFSTAQKEWVELNYELHGDTLDTYGPLGAAQWKRVKGAHSENGAVAEDNDHPTRTRTRSSGSSGSSGASDNWRRFIPHGYPGF